MKYSLLKLGSIALIVAAVGLIVSIACGTSDEEAAPTPDVARIIQDAVNSVPQGASAAEIQGLVSESVAPRRLPHQPAGITRAEVEAAVNSLLPPVSSRPPTSSGSSTSRFATLPRP